MGNRFTMSDLLSCKDPNSLINLSITELEMLQNEIAEEAAKVKVATERLRLTLGIKYTEAADTQRRRLRKPTGVVHLFIDEADIVCDVPKRVEWDQDKIKTAFSQMADGEYSRYAKHTLSVAEKDYAAAGPEIVKLLEPARIVKLSPQKFTINSRATAEV
jgi:hypothetical protein